MPESSPASPKRQTIDLAPGDWDPLPEELKWSPYQEGDLQPPYSVLSRSLGGRYSNGCFDNGGTWGNTTSPLFDPVQLMFHTQLLDLQAKYQQAKADIEEFTIWSKKMEKHTQEMNSTLLDLFRIIREPEFVRGLLEKPNE
ncbi:hypothetical protein PG987_004239 [Apiospora arundinis]